MVDNTLEPLDPTLISSKFMEFDIPTFISSQSDPTNVTVGDIIKYIISIVNDDIPGCTYAEIGNKKVPGIVFPNVRNIESDVHIFCGLGQIDPTNANNNPFTGGSSDNTDNTANIIIADGLKLYPVLAVVNLNDNSYKYYIRSDEYGRTYYGIYNYVYYNTASNGWVYERYEIDRKIVFKYMKYNDIYFITSLCGLPNNLTINWMVPTLGITYLNRMSDDKEIPCALPIGRSQDDYQCPQLLIADESYIHVISEGQYGYIYAYNSTANEEPNAYLQFTYRLNDIMYYSKNIFIGYGCNFTSSTDRISTDILNTKKKKVNGRTLSILELPSSISGIAGSYKSAILTSS